MRDQPEKPGKQAPQQQQQPTPAFKLLIRRHWQSPFPLKLIRIAVQQHQLPADSMTTRTVHWPRIKALLQPHQHKRWLSEEPSKTLRLMH
jgi:hypothetical protein